MEEVGPIRTSSRPSVAPAALPTAGLTPLERQVSILVLGAGPTGLGAATRLQQHGHADWLLLEQVGGPLGLIAAHAGSTARFFGPSSAASGPARLPSRGRTVPPSRDAAHSWAPPPCFRPAVRVASRAPR
jgi:monoamine oxidase